MINLHSALYGRNSEKLAEQANKAPAGIDYDIMQECGVDPEKLDSNTLAIIERISRTARIYGYYCGVKSTEYKHRKQAKAEKKAREEGQPTEEIEKPLQKHRLQWFENFWDLYPKKVNKYLAKREFMKVCWNEAQYQEIMEGLYRLNDEDYSYREKNFILNPNSFLRDQRWTDEPITHNSQEKPVR